jgi:hypothetical protein
VKVLTDSIEHSAWDTAPLKFFIWAHLFKLCRMILPYLTRLSLCSCLGKHLLFPDWFRWFGSPLIDVAGRQFVLDWAIGFVTPPPLFLYTIFFTYQMRVPKILSSNLQVLRSQNIISCVYITYPLKSVYTFLFYLHVWVRLSYSWCIITYHAIHIDNTWQGKWISIIIISNLNEYMCLYKPLLSDVKCWVKV